MIEDILASPRALAGNDVDHARRQDIADEMHQFEDAQGRRTRRLEDDGAACRQGRSQFPRCHEEGEIPGDDLADDTDWLVDDETQRMVVDDRRPAVFTADDAGKIAEMIDCQGDVDILRFPDGLAVVQRFHHSQHIGILFDDISKGKEQILPFLGRCDLPCRERFMSCRYGHVDIVFCRFGTLCQLRPVSGIIRREPGAIAGRDPFATNI